MPVPSFLASFADKAQSAINASPLAAHLPANLSSRPTSPDAANQPSANDSAAQGGHKSHTFDAIQHQFRSLQQQYSTTSPVQKVITAEKGVAIDFDSVSRDSKAQSKELYTWGQSEAEDLKDVTDRLAYLNFVQGSLASSLAIKLDSARASMKALRDAEAALLPRRNIRAGIQNQIGRLEHAQQKGTEKTISDLRGQLKKAEQDDLPLEREIELLKRKAVRESERLKWEALREYGEKLVLLSQTATPIIAALPTLPPNQASPYTGAQVTGAARASLQRALDNYKTGHINLPPQVAGSDLSRSDTRSFGESHASELSNISTDSISLQSSIPTTPPVVSQPLAQVPPTEQTSPPEQAVSPPINPLTLNQSPSPIPAVVNAATTPIALDSGDTSITVPTIIPTVAETGVPVSAGPSGPGPASGSLHDIRGASSLAGPRSGGLPGNESQIPAYGEPPASNVASSQKLESAEEEKKRLAAAYTLHDSAVASAPSTATPQAAAAVSPPHESAEEEKKRLEREERERFLQAGSSQGGPPKKDGADEDLPPYQEPGSQ
ncbi:uncharacterized protein LACBIDRAFT_291511 [Laccaria bicolor S238N-H82]|uniref:Predicted protein n=1 Tax=Laccaria bicolor (strain S238N-H82 / ATCC MYA-4686) TaxID=486041 RepID=B0CQ57_LACBS|nr:uncharacterized protein LACBIDRAFT_291511 [Laccaria bicolor S238N-H82]EDR15014.1 predicted protein [Laccaria bicolor S238N-H82]|eukprot:XP_001873222.1 predicted protein [Laccaria bicolor S238N-H82]